MQRKNLMRFLLVLPTNFIRNAEAKVRIWRGFSNLVRAGLGLTLIKTWSLFWAGYNV